MTYEEAKQLLKKWDSPYFTRCHDKECCTYSEDDMLAVIEAAKIVARNEQRKKDGVIIAKKQAGICSRNYPQISKVLDQLRVEILNPEAQQALNPNP